MKHTIGNTKEPLKKILFFCFLFFAINLGAETDGEKQKVDQKETSIIIAKFNLKTEAGLAEFYQYIETNNDVLPSSQKKILLKIGLKEALNLDQPHKIHDFSSSLSDFFYFGDAKSNLDSVIFYSKSLLYSSKKLGPLYFAKANNKIGSAHLMSGNMMKALDYFYESVKYFKLSSSPDEVTYPLSNISYIYSYHQDFEQAIKFSKEGLKRSQSLCSMDRAYNVIFNCSDLVELYISIDQLDSSQYYIDIGAREVNNFDTVQLDDRFTQVFFNFYQTGVSYYLKVKDYDNARRLFNKALKSPLINSPYGVLLKIQYATETNDLDRANDLITQNEAAFLRDSNLVDNANFTAYKAEFFVKKKDYKNAYETYKEYKEHEDKSYKLKTLKLAGYMQSKLDNEIKENKIQLLASENKVKSIQLRYLGIGLLFLTLGVLLFSLQYWQLIKKNKMLADQSKIIKEQSKKLKEEVEMKENLFGNISHELRTPLTLISGSINELLDKEGQDEGSRKKIEVISTYSNQLLNMSNQILDLLKSKLEAQKVHLFSFNMEELLTYLKWEFSPKAKKQNIQLLFLNPQIEKLTLITDVEKLMLVLKNLIQNALKYNNESGKITVSYTIEEGQLRFYITDTGQGIAKEDLPYIFDRFYQSSNYSKTRMGGVGLGLAICKETVAVLEGDIQVKSEEETGTEFQVTIPIKSTSESKESHPAYLFPRILSTTKTELPTVFKNEYPEDFILIVEDNLDLCSHLNNILQNDYYLSFAHDGKEALAQIEKRIPKAIITDWMMPGMSGEALVKHLKSHEAYFQIPILMLTARNKSDDRGSLLRIGVDDYLTKPFVQENLKAHLGHLVDLADNRLKNKEENAEYKGLNKSELIFLERLEQITIKKISDFGFNLTSLAEELELGTRQLNRKVKQLTGLTPMQYINEVRFQEAKKMLENRTYSSVKAVAYSVGFKAEKNFSRNFKKRFGKYPKDILY